MEKPTLLVLAAGMGSRYGGLKQLDPLGPHGETIMDYSIYDALRAGFGRVVFVIRHDFEEAFRERVCSKYDNSIDVHVVFQSTDALPDGYTCPADRTRPWGTNHAIMMSSGVIDGPFAVINADDFYGYEAFDVMAKHFAQTGDNTSGQYCMVGFRVGNTMTRNGSVSRGVCTVKDGKLSKIVERKKIYYAEGDSIVYDDENGMPQPLEADVPVSMNLWGFTPDYFKYSEREFRRFLDKYLNEPSREFFIPSVVDKLIGNGEASVTVLDTPGKWFGVTYAQDREHVVQALADLHRQGAYPEKLFAQSAH